MPVWSADSPGGKPDRAKQGFRGETLTAAEVKERYGVTKVMVARWRKNLRNEAAYRKSLKKSCKHIILHGKPNYGFTGNNEWYVNSSVIRAANRVMGGIDCDPASCKEAQKTVQAGVYFTKEDDGLTMDWIGRIFLNPPYNAKDMVAFIGKLLAEIKAGRVTEAIVLVHNRADTPWFGKLLEACECCCFNSSSS